MLGLGRSTLIQTVGAQKVLNDTWRRTMVIWRCGSDMRRSTRGVRPEDLESDDARQTRLAEGIRDRNVGL